MNPMDELDIILPPEMIARATRVGHECVLPMTEANEAVRLASAHHIAILGVERVQILDDDLSARDSSAYDFEFKGHWPSYVYCNNEAALRFMERHQASPGHGFILTTASQEEFKAQGTPPRSRNSTDLRGDQDL